jgi:hypothetical protein
MKKSARQKGLHEMTYEELGQELERMCGLPCPPREASREDRAAYEVASSILLQMRFTPDPEVARKEAIEWTLKHPAYPLNELRPHIERAMGRRLLDAEMEGGVLYDRLIRSRGGRERFD